MGGAESGRKLHVFLDGQVVVECIVLRDVGEESFEGVEVLVEGLAVEKDFAFVRAELSRDGS